MSKGFPKNHEDLQVRLNALFTYAGTSEDEVLEQRKLLMENNIKPSKILIPGCKYYGIPVEFYHGEEIRVIGENDE